MGPKSTTHKAYYQNKSCPRRHKYGELRKMNTKTKPDVANEVPTFCWLRILHGGNNYCRPLSKDEQTIQIRAVLTAAKVSEMSNLAQIHIYPPGFPPQPAKGVAYSDIFVVKTDDEMVMVKTCDKLNTWRVRCFL